MSFLLIAMVQLAIFSLLWFVDSFPALAIALISSALGYYEYTKAPDLVSSWLSVLVAGLLLTIYIHAKTKQA